MVITIPRHHLRALQASVATPPETRKALLNVFLDLTDPAAPVAVATDGHRMTVVSGLRVIEDAPTASENLLFRPVKLPVRGQRPGDDVTIDTAARTASWPDGKGECLITQELTISDEHYPDWRDIAGRMRAQAREAVGTIGMDFSLMAPIAAELRTGKRYAPAQVFFRGAAAAIEVQWSNEPDVVTWLMPLR